MESEREPTKACPFCGGVGAIYHYADLKQGHLVCIKCTQCGAQGSPTAMREGAEPALDAWNQRTEPVKKKRRRKQ